MQNHQFAETLLTNAIRAPSVLGLWLFLRNSPLKPITKEEEHWIKRLSLNKGIDYHFSRGCLRYALSQIFDEQPENIPLEASPGKPPLLPNGWGNISLSHCKDALSIAWSPTPIGIDIERSDRKFNAAALAKRYFSQEEKKALKGIPLEQRRIEILNMWVVKEAAVKWERSKLANNLDKWIWQKETSSASHRLLKHEINIYQSHYKNWTIAIAYNKDIQSLNPIFCLE